MCIWLCKTLKLLVKNDTGIDIFSQKETSGLKILTFKHWFAHFNTLEGFKSIAGITHRQTYSHLFSHMRSYWLPIQPRCFSLEDRRKLVEPGETHRANEQHTKKKQPISNLGSSCCEATKTTAEKYFCLICRQIWWLSSHQIPNEYFSCSYLCNIHKDIYTPVTCHCWLFYNTDMSSSFFPCHSQQIFLHHHCPSSCNHLLNHNVIPSASVHFAYHSCDK